MKEIQRERELIDICGNLKLPTNVITRLGFCGLGQCLELDNGNSVVIWNSNFLTKHGDMPILAHIADEGAEVEPTDRSWFLGYVPYISLGNETARNPGHSYDVADALLRAEHGPTRLLTWHNENDEYNVNDNVLSFFSTGAAYGVTSEQQLR